MDQRFEKLTYSGTDCNNYLYLSFHADTFDVEEVTRSLEIEPTSVMVKNDPVPKSTAWMYKIEVGDQIDLLAPLHKLIDLFEAKIDDINDLKDRLGLNTRLQFVIDIDIDPNASTPNFPLNKRAIDFLSRTRTEVDFDLYKADTIGLLKR